MSLFYVICVSVSVQTDQTMCNPVFLRCFSCFSYFLYNISFLLSNIISRCFAHSFNTSPLSINLAMTMPSSSVSGSMPISLYQAFHSGSSPGQLVKKWHSSSVIPPLQHRQTLSSMSMFLNRPVSKAKAKTPLFNLAIRLH